MTQRPLPDQQSPIPTQKGTGLGVTSLVLSLIGLVVFSWIPVVGVLLGVPLGLLGLIFGIVAVAKAPSRGGSGKGLGIAGLALGIAAIPVSVLSLLLLGNQAAAFLTDWVTG
jgi:hypothetical protein